MFASSASAKEIHVLSNTFGSGELSLQRDSGVAIDQETKVLYVGDTGNGRVPKFDGSTGAAIGNLGTFAAPTFVAVDNSPSASHGDVYVVETGGGEATISKLTPAGTLVTGWGSAGHLTGLGQIAGIAVGVTGDLWVYSTAGILRTYPPAYVSPAAPASECSTGHPGPAEGIGVDSTGAVWTSVPGNLVNSVAKLDVSCNLIGGVQGLQMREGGLAVDQSDDHLLASEAGGSVSEFSSTGVLLESEMGRPAAGARKEGGGLSKTGQLAVLAETSEIFAVIPGQGEIAALTLENVEPPTATLEPPTDITGTSAQITAHIDPDAPSGNPVAYRVAYEFVCHPRCENGSKERGELPAVSVNEEVKATLGLQPATNYEVFLVAANAAAATEVPQPGLKFSSAAIAPAILEQWIEANALSTSEATFKAIVDAGGAETATRFQYVTQTQFEASGFSGAEETPVGNINGRKVPISAVVSGLAADTAYVFRTVASNSVTGPLTPVVGEPVFFRTQQPSAEPEIGCPNQVFRVGLGAFLPDCRAYERSSPADKNGGGAEGYPGTIQASPSGNGITFFSQAGIPGGVGAQDYPTFLASRGNGAWTTQGLLPPQELGEKAEYLGLTPDFRYAITEATLGGSTKDTAVFARNLENGAVTTVVPYNAGCGELCFTLAGASTDGQKIFLETRLALDKEPPTTLGQQNLYVWDRDSGEISLVGVRENGEPLPEGAFAGAYNWATPKNSQGGAASGAYVSPLHAISRNGDQVVYTERRKDISGEEGQNPNQLYVRLGLNGNSPHSVKISDYEAGRSGPELPAAFLEATPDGHFVFFMSKAELTSNSYAGEGSASLYRYDTVTGKLADLTTKKFQAGPGVIGMLGASESGKIAYFVSTTELTSAPGPGGRTAKPGEANLYRWQEGASPAIAFVAALRNGTIPTNSTSDFGDWTPVSFDPTNQGTPLARTARVSADGSSLVFSSHNALTGAVNGAPGCNSGRLAGPLESCAEFFRYSAAADTLDCISCDPTGARPLGGATVGTPIINAADPPIVLPAPAMSRNLSAGGDRFFFQTPDPLVAHDVNARGGCSFNATSEVLSCLDVYEWEAPGTGSCSHAVADGGCLNLISSGQADGPSYFGDADLEGTNAFILTASQLVSSDRDQLYDVYDAAEGGGLPSQNESPAIRCASQQACQGPLAGPESGTSPGSPSFNGKGNPKPPKCKKGFVRRHGKCVKKGKPKQKKGKPRKHSTRRPAGHGHGGKK
jgi:hypothetical protein